MIDFQDTNISSIDIYDKTLFKIIYKIGLAHGESFFDVVVKSLSKNLGLKYVFIGEKCVNKNYMKIKSLWTGDSLIKDFEYALSGTPCERVLLEGTKVYPKNVGEFFPNAIKLKKWNIQSYIGIPLINDKGQSIGNIVVLNDKFIDNISWVQQIVEICANRVAAELERSINDEIFTQHKEKEGLKNIQLAHSISLLEATIESTADGLLIVDSQGNMTRFNNQFIEMWQIPKEIIDAKDDDLALNYAVSQLQTPQQFIDKVMELYGKPEAVSFDVLHFKDGRIFERYSQPQKIGNKTVGRVWSFRDVTQKVVIEKELKESEHLFRSLFEESPIGIVMDVDKKNKLVHVNKKFAQMLGYSMEELAQMTAKDITYPDDLYNYKKALQKLNNKKNDYNFEKRYKTKNGELIWGDVSLSIVKKSDNSFRHRVVMIQDITEKKNALIEIEKKAAELNEKNKELQKYIDSNMQLENFAYIASHDLREPLLTIKGLVDILIENYAEQLDEEASSFLKFIEQCAKNMELLINDLLTYSRVNTQVHTVAHFNMEELLQKVMNGLQNTIEVQNASIQFAGIPPKMIANETKMLQ
ncbi:MAG: GAF domain-containing sensor histidine kinase, partial [Chitinophagales bacterium]